MLIAEEYLLLALDEKTGKLRVGSDALGPALGGALVAELALRERIGVTPYEAGWTKRGRVTIISTTPTERTVALIALLQVTTLLPKVVTTDDKRALKAKAKELTSGDWAAKAVKDAIDEAAAATTAAIGAATVASAGS